jgi:hypothetical protein
MFPSDKYLAGYAGRERRNRVDLHMKCPLWSSDLNQN